MPLVSGPSATSPEAEIAAAMANAIRSNEVFDIPEVTVDDPVDIVRSVEDLEAGRLLIDVWPAGIGQEQKNRRAFEWEFEIHVGVRMKLAGPVTRQSLNVMMYYRWQAQRIWTPKSIIETQTVGRVFLSEAEPFAPYAREKLHGAGLFIAPIRFVWKAVAR